MLIAMILGIGAAVAGIARGGSLDSLAATKFKAAALLPAGLLLQIGFELWSPPWLTREGALLILLASNLLIAIFLALNQRTPGILLAALGLILNVSVIALNGAMPVSQEASDRAGITMSIEDAGLKHERLDDDTKLPWLADVLPVPGVREVLSIGDVILALGIARLIFARTTARPSVKRPAASD